MSIQELQFCFGLSPQEAQEVAREAGGDFDKAAQIVEKRKQQQPIANHDLASALQNVMGGNVNTTLSKEDQDMQKALEASMQTSTNTAMDIEGSMDMQLQRAVEESLKDTGGTDAITMSAYSTNPNFRKREPATPTGLKNVGNTCYFNSLLQTYFHIPELRRAVLSFPPTELLTAKDKGSTVEFMRALQKLFAFMLLSNQKWVDPSPLLKKILDRNGQPINIGNQEDVSEFNELFLERIAEGLELTSDLNQSKNTACLISNLFQGTAVKYLNGKEEDGSPVESAQDDIVIAHLILPVWEEEGLDLYRSLDRAVTDSVQWTTPKGYKTQAQLAQWFKTLPDVLLFQQNRVQYDSEAQTYKKLNTPMDFNLEITMDRYFLENRKRTTEVRAVVNQWRDQLSALKLEINKITHYKGRDHCLTDALGSTIDYLVEKGDDSPILQKLMDYKKEEEDRLSALRSDAAGFENDIKTAYNDFPAEHTYSLFAVWVHSGVAGSGHYWAYMRCGKSKEVEEAQEEGPTEKGKEKQTPNEMETDSEPKEWRKFNDLRINVTDIDEVMDQSLGGNGSSTAYFLIYTKTDKFIEIRNSYLPDADSEADYLTSSEVIKEVEEDNAKFLETLEKYNTANSDDKITKFVVEYEKMVALSKEFAEQAVNTFCVKDLRISSFYAWLYSLGYEDVARNEILNSVYTFIFQRSFEKDIGFSCHAKLKEKLGDEIINSGVEYAFKREQQFSQFKEQYELFRVSSFHLSSALSYFFDQRLEDPIYQFKQALKVDESLSLNCKRRHLIEAVIHIVIKILWHNFIMRGDVNHLKCCVLYIFVLVPKQHKFFAEMKNLYTNFYNTSTDVSPMCEEIMRLFISPINGKFKYPKKKLEIVMGSDSDKWQVLSETLTHNILKLKEQYPEIYSEYLPWPTQTTAQMVE
eukprot:CAMPEP_0174251172 /NCGR_PEP_ID=MMETSP0439-20130205/1081_1 /TAXON_ID=0 /ORGANISM="Stereomyxa ramosa, Strain Chinc5" /LENGTH=918 /DNA_ID=CAMNT_0015331415 /DNA_START=79 /DNA_END=2835 /DNA_ORIENTATION=+